METVVCIETGVSTIPGVVCIGPPVDGSGPGVDPIDTGVSTIPGVVCIGAGDVCSGPVVSGIGGRVSLGTGPGNVVGGFPQIHLPHVDGVVLGVVIIVDGSGSGVCGTDAFGVVAPGMIVVLVSLCGTEPIMIVVVKAPAVPDAGPVVPDRGPLDTGPVVPSGVAFVVPIIGVVDFESKYGRYPVAWGVVDFGKRYGK